MSTFTHNLKKIMSATLGGAEPLPDPHLATSASVDETTTLINQLCDVARGSTVTESMLPMLTVYGRELENLLKLQIASQRMSHSLDSPMDINLLLQTIKTFLNAKIKQKNRPEPQKDGDVQKNASAQPAKFLRSPATHRVFVDMLGYSDSRMIRALMPLYQVKHILTSQRVPEEWPQHKEGKSADADILMRNIYGALKTGEWQSFKEQVQFIHGCLAKREQLGDNRQALKSALNNHPDKVVRQLYKWRKQFMEQSSAQHRLESALQPANATDDGGQITPTLTSSAVEAKKQALAKEMINEWRKRKENIQALADTIFPMLLTTFSAQENKNEPFAFYACKEKYMLRQIKQKPNFAHYYHEVSRELQVRYLAHATTSTEAVVVVETA